MVNNSTNINKITSHINSLSDGQQFHQYQQTSPLTLTHWMMVNNSTNINKNHLSPQLIGWNCWPSFNELRWEVMFADIGGIVDHHPMSWGERWFLLILVELLTITQCIEVRGDFCWYWWNCWRHSMSWSERWFLLILVKLLTITQCIEVRGDFCWYWWWSTIPPISTKITSHFNSLSDVNNSTNINKNHLSYQLIEWC